MGTARWSGSLAARVRRHRRTLAAMAAGLAVLTLGLALRPAPPAVTEMVVVAADLPAGHRLELGDLALAPMPAAVALPGQAADPESLVGQVLAAPLLRGEPLTTSRLVASWGPADLPSGAVPQPVRFADAEATRWLTAGQRIDVLAARALGEESLGAPTESLARVIARSATVLVLPGREGDAGTLSPSSTTSGQGPPVLLAVSPAEALAIAGAEATSRLSYRLEPAPPRNSPASPYTAPAPSANPEAADARSADPQSTHPPSAGH